MALHQVCIPPNLHTIGPSINVQAMAGLGRLGSSARARPAKACLLATPDSNALTSTLALTGAGRDRSQHSERGVEEIILLGK